MVMLVCDQDKNYIRLKGGARASEHKARFIHLCCRLHGLVEFGRDHQCDLSGRI